MANVFVRISNKHKVILLCEKPMRFSQLTEELAITETGLNKILKPLQEKGWLHKKMKRGGYELTQAGRKMLPQAQIAASLLLDFRTSPILAKNVTVHHQGLEGDDAQTLLSDIAQPITRYITKHPNKPITLLIQYSL
jgi:Mn-dependent DtxR family transcriptional regulator